MANENGWGDGSVNNAIGWGQGANNAISWGKSHLDSWSGATDIDGGNAPINTVAPALSGTAQEGQNLTCSTGTWSGSPTYTYQWKRNGNNIGSATNSTYTLVTADVGQSIKCTVTATNFSGSANADSNTVTPTSSVDADAQAFITAASITDPTQQSAINQLVVDLKGYNIWTKMKAIYPFCGSTASQHKWNLKDPRDLDAAFRLQFINGWTHSANGATPNGIDGYADTKLTPSTTLTQLNTHLSFYSRTNSTAADRVAIGSANSPAYTTSHALTLKASDGNYYASIDRNIAAGFANTNSQGFYIGSRTANNSLKSYKNNSVVATLATTITPVANNSVIYIGARNETGSLAQLFDNKQCSFASIGDGLTDTQAANFYTAVQAFQTTLGRQV